MSDRATTILWLRRDLRLADHPAMTAAIARGGPVIAVFVADPEAAFGGAAARWRLSRSLASFERALRAIGGRLILRQGGAATVLSSIARETSAGAVFWSRFHDAASRAQEQAVAKVLEADDVEACGCPGPLLLEPGAVLTQSGDPFKVYTPFSKAAMAGPEPAAPEKAPTRWPAPETWPESESLAALGLEAAMNRGGEVLARYAKVGEQAARDCLDAFLDDAVARYAADRDRVDLEATSGLSEHLAMGEIGPRAIWRATMAAMERRPEAEKGGWKFLKEVLWREFAWHLLEHAPDMATRNWREEWDDFPWRSDNDDAERWRRGRTGQPLVDAAMRELYVTGRMHNRARMVVASYLTKHLLTDWRVGEEWFRDCLIDWDPASNAMGWQWVAGSGPDAAPFFRIFNPETQAEKFDPDGAYVARWLPERGGDDLLSRPHEDGLAFFDACPRSWNMSPDDPYPDPVVDLGAGRRRALEAYENRDSGQAAKAATKPARRTDDRQTQYEQAQAEQAQAKQAKARSRAS